MVVLQSLLRGQRFGRRFQRSLLAIFPILLIIEAGQESTSTTNSKLDPGVVSAGVYRNAAFGFMCKIPPAWVLRTEEMNRQQGEDEKADAGKKATDAGRVLLAAFSRPPEARAEDVNSFDS